MKKNVLFLLVMFFFGTMLKAQTTYSVYTEDFDDSDASDWISVDLDGDGYGWARHGVLSVSSYAWDASTYQVLACYGYNFDGNGSYETIEQDDRNNWVISPEISLRVSSSSNYYYGGTLKLILNMQYPIGYGSVESMSVYGSTSPDFDDPEGAFTLIGTITPGTSFAEQELDITDWIGDNTTFYLAFSCDFYSYSHAIGYEINTFTIQASDVVEGTAVTGISLNKSNSAVSVGGTETLIAAIAPSDASNQTITWSSSDESIATVDEDGVVTGVAVGTTTIIATTEDGDYKSSCTVTVQADPILVTSISIDSASLTMEKGDIQQLNVLSLLPTNATVKTVAWTSSDKSVATVDADGNVTAKATGTAVISASANDEGAISTTCAVSVTTPITNLINYPAGTSTLKLFVGDTLTIGARVLPVDADEQGVTFKLPDGYEDYFSFDSETHLVTAKAVSYCQRIYMYTVGEFNTTRVFDYNTIDLYVIEDAEVSVTGITLSASEKTLTTSTAYNETAAKLTATVTPSNADYSGVMWTTSDLGVAYCSGSQIYVQGEGTCVLTATTIDGRHSATCQLTVTGEAVTGVTLSPSSYTLSLGHSLSLNAVVSPSDASNDTVSYTSSDESVATVTSKGVVTAVGVGSATITVTTADGGYTATSVITVPSVAVTAISLNKSTASLSTGGNTQLTATISPEDATNTDIAWTSSDATVAKVSSNGLVTGVAAGTATITATTSDGGYTATCSVTVSSDIAVTGISLDITSDSLDIDETLQLTATISPEDATNTNVTWTSSSAVAATVSDGLVTALANGTTTITAVSEDGNYTASCAIVVGTGIADSTITEGESSISEVASDAEAIRVYPNPATGNTVTLVTNSTEGGLVSIYNVTGKMVMQQVVAAGSASTEIDIEDLNSGLYMLRFAAADGQISMLKLVK